MVRDSPRGVEMTHRTMNQAIAEAYAALQAGDFAKARDATAAHTANPQARLLHALGQAGSNAYPDAAASPSAATLDAIARANPAARHPVLDLVDLLHRADRSNETPVHLRAALTHQPNDPGLLAMLGAAESRHGNIAAAVTLFHQVTELTPNDAAAWSNLGKAEAAQGAFTAAEQAFTRAARLAPGNAQLRLNHAIARLKSGRLAEGWPLFRARHALPGRAPAPPGPELRTLDGLANQTVLLLHDEGFGDTIQFIRYAPLLTARGARVVVRAPPPLHRLLASNGIELATPATRPDAWCRIPDLPALFGTTLENVPARLPYLTPDPALITHWSRHLPPKRPATRRIGLAWAGAARTHDPAAQATDRIRSIPPARLAPLWATQHVTWISLQHGATPPDGISNPMPAVQDFADTAAIIANLDLVISVDTAVAHLAAAMARPVLLLDRHDNCWRWLSNRTDSPWYPGVLTIIRQQHPGDWTGVLHTAQKMLERHP